MRSKTLAGFKFTFSRWSAEQLSLRFWRMLSILGNISGNSFPTGFGTHKSVTGEFDVRVFIDTTQGYPVNVVLLDATQCRPTQATKLQTKTLFTSIRRQVL